MDEYSHEIHEMKQRHLFEELRGVVGDAGNLFCPYGGVIVELLNDSKRGNWLRRDLEMLRSFGPMEHFYEYVGRQTCTAHVNNHEALKEPARIFENCINSVNQKLEALWDIFDREPLPADDALLSTILQKVEIQNLLLQMMTEIEALNEYSIHWKPVITHSPIPDKLP
jgi:hypothetical protein